MIKTLDYAETQEGGEKGRAFELKACLVAEGDTDTFLIPDDIKNLCVTAQASYGATAAIYTTTDLVRSIKTGSDPLIDLPVTGAITDASVDVVIVTDGITVGDVITAIGIPSGTKVATVDGSAAITLDASASLTDASAAITISGRTTTLTWEKWSGGDATTAKSSNFYPVSAIKMTQTGTGESKMTLRAQ